MATKHLVATLGAALISIGSVVVSSVAVVGPAAADNPQIPGASTVQCAVGVDSSGSSITCAAATAGAATSVACDSVEAISRNGSVYTLFPHTCRGTISGIGTADATFDGDTPLTIDSATGAVNAVHTQSFTGQWSENGNTVRGRCAGSVLSETLAPFTASIGNAWCTATLDVLGVGTATVTGTGSTLRVVTAPHVAVTLTGPDLALTSSTALLGPVAATCATSVGLNPATIPPVSAMVC